jgi:hypothetical protein
MFHEEWYPDGQLQELEKLCQSVKSLEGDVLEIGCWEGRSAIKLCNAFYPETVLCLDTWKGNVNETKATG